MTLDTSTIPSAPSFPQIYGVQVSVFPFDTVNRLEVWRAPDNGSGAPNDAASVQAAILPPGPLGGVTFVDPLPNDNAKRYYKVRHIDEVGNVSAFTAYSDAGVPVLVTGTGLGSIAPMAAFGAIVDAPPPNTKYEMRMASTYADPDFTDGMQSYIDFATGTNFMRLGASPKAILGSTAVNPSVVNVTAHGYTTGDVVTIRGHLVNTAINGTWVITVTDADHFSVPILGTGTGIGTGHVVKLRMTVKPNGDVSLYGGALTAGLVQDRNAKFVLDLDGALLTVNDNQGSPVARVKVGKVGAGTTDYGIQVFDSAAATVIDFTGAKRILAVPVQPSVDSGTAVTVDLSTGLTQQVRLTGTATVTFTNPVNGGRYRTWFQQDPTGSRPFPTILSADGVVMFTNDTAPTLTTTPGALDLFEFEYRVTPTKRFTCMTLQTNVLLPTPNVVSVTPTSNAASLSQAAVWPATTASGDLMVICIATSGASAKTTPSGWTLVSSSGICAVYAYVANGTEGGSAAVQIVTAVSESSAVQMYRINKWFGTTAGISGSGNTGAPGTSADPAAQTPLWGVDRSLWFDGCGVIAAPAITDPANYGNFQQTDSTGATVRLRTGRRILYATTDDSAAFTWTGSQTWAALAFVVRPPA